jgi:glycosyltransferase involved in cell wall biosynthesis
MKVGFIFPVNRRCGISVYAHGCVHALSRLVSVEQLDAEECALRPARPRAIIDNCDIVHIQYETSLYRFGDRDYYPAVCRMIAAPKIVTLHEVYDDPPGVFPRSRITGGGPIVWVRCAIWDARHPLQTAQRRHAARHWYAGRVLVHSQAQQAVLSRQGADMSRVGIVEYPVRNSARPHAWDFRPGAPLELAAVGFINPNYDYPLLFAALDAMKTPWRFCWIGGIRREEEAGLLENLRQEIASRGWEDRFAITEWVADAQRDELLLRAHICLALFSARSNSESLATMLGMQKPVVATPLPFIREIEERHRACMTAEPNAAAIAAAVEQLARDAGMRARLSDALERYCAGHSYEAMARQLFDIYRGMAGA